MNAEIKDRIMAVLQKETRVDPATIDPDVPIREQIVLDSMQFISIIARLELEFDMTIPNTVMAVETLNQFIEAVEGVVCVKA